MIAIAVFGDRHAVFGDRLAVFGDRHAPFSVIGMLRFRRSRWAETRIWIDGIANRDLFEYCRALQRTGEALGCGLYPRGSHVHIDVRSSATIWVDLSGYGDGADYVQHPDPWLDGHPDAGHLRAWPEDPG